MNFTMFNIYFINNFTMFFLTGKTAYISLRTYNISTIDKQAQNEEFETRGDNILDFTEINPFSEANTY